MTQQNGSRGKLPKSRILPSHNLIVLGFVGTFVGNIIKAAISRQRERLADASGVQFTRNPFGLAGALKRIGGEAMGSQLQAPAAAEISHFLFAEGVWKSMAGLWSSHPPLDERICAWIRAGTESTLSPVRPGLKFCGLPHAAVIGGYYLTEDGRINNTLQSPSGLSNAT